MAETVKDTTYNGWSNYETWSVNLICTNEQWLDREYRSIAGRAADEEDDKELKRIRAADALKEWISEEIDQIDWKAAGDIGMLAEQLVGASLSEVDWLEIADAALEK